MGDVGALLLDDGADERYRVEYPDVLAEAGTSVAELVYQGGGVAALSSIGPGRLFLAGFPLETLLPDQGRRAVLEVVVDSFLGAPTDEPDICGSPFPGAVEPVESEAGQVASERPVDLVPAPSPEIGDAKVNEPSAHRRHEGCGCAANTSPAWILVLLIACVRRKLRTRRQI